MLNLQRKRKVRADAGGAEVTARDVARKLVKEVVRKAVKRAARKAASKVLTRVRKVLAHHLQVLHQTKEREQRNPNPKKNESIYK